MTTKEQVYELVERLDADQLEEALAYLERLAEGEEVEELSAEDLAAIREGLEDIKAGRVLSLDEYEQGKRL